jgi:hypothetical protein
LLEYCSDDCPSERFSHINRGTLELCQSDYWFLGHLPDQGPSPPIAQFGWAASSRKSPFKGDEDHCVLGDFCERKITYLPDLFEIYNISVQLMLCFYGLHPNMVLLEMA